MQEFQKRVVAEQEELQKKITALAGFTQSKLFSSVSVAERYRLARQLSAMNTYNDILLERISEF